MGNNLPLLGNNLPLMLYSLPWNKIFPPWECDSPRLPLVKWGMLMILHVNLCKNILFICVLKEKLSIFADKKEII